MTRPASPDAVSQGSSQRIDKWLWFARLVKTRTLGTRLVSGGKIRINREKIDKPSYGVKIDDVITARIGRRILVVKVVATGSRRGPAREAAQLYADLTPREPALQKVTGPGQKKIGNHEKSTGTFAQRLPGSGRPTKRERRALNRLKEYEN